MSLVQAVVTENFIIVAAETRGIKPDGTMIDSCNKLVKLNSQIIFGCTGGVKDNYELFEGFCNYSNEKGLTKLNDDIIMSYKEFVYIITKKFNELKMIHDDKSNSKTYEIMSIVCGYNGNEFEGTTFSLSPNDNQPNGIFVAKRKWDFPYKCISAGKIEHKEEFEKLTNQYHDIGLYDFTTIRQYKNILMEVFERCSIIDSEINNNVVFERIRLKDVIKK